MEDINISDHAYLRAKQRLGLKNKSFKKLAEKAFISGVTHSELKGQPKKYVSWLYLRNRTANNIRIYGEVIFLFSKNNLITVYKLPNRLSKKVLKINKSGSNEKKSH